MLRTEQFAEQNSVYRLVSAQMLSLWGRNYFSSPPTRWQTEKLFIYFVLKFPRPTNSEAGASRGFSE